MVEHIEPAEALRRIQAIILRWMQDQRASDREALAEVIDELESSGFGFTNREHVMEPEGEADDNVHSAVQARWRPQARIRPTPLTVLLRRPGPPGTFPIRLL